MLKDLYRHLSHFILLSCVIIGFQFCSKDENTPVIPTSYERGEIAQSNSLGIMVPNEIQQILSNASMTIPFTLSYPVETISINYYSIDGSGKQIIVSGALLVPQGKDNLPLVSVQHGTETKRELVASISPTNSTEGIVGLIMASMGYLVVVPDYLGFGTSNVMHPYTHAASLIPSIVDIMRAGKSYSTPKSNNIRWKNIPNRLFGGRLCNVSYPKSD